MEQFEKIIQGNRETVANRIRKSFNIDFQLSEGETEGKTVKKAFSNELSSVYNKAISHEESWEEMQKAHKDGDMHPNGKWVWVSSANGGRGDWRTAGGRTHSKSSSVKSSDKEEETKSKLDDHAKNASDEALKKVIQSENASDELKAAAKKELKNREKESSSDSKKDEFEFKSRPGHKTGKFIQGDGYSVAYAKYRDNRYAVMANLNYEDKAGEEMIIGLKGDVSSLKEAKELSMKIAKDLKDKKVLDTLRNMEKDFISKMKGKTATEIRKFEFSWEDVLKASKEEEFEFKSRPGHKTGKFIQGDGYSVAYAKYGDDRYVVMTNLNYEDKAGEEMIIGLKGDVSSLKEAKELSMKIAKDLKDKKVMDTLRNMEKDFIFKTKKITATQIRKFEYSWEDVLKASKEE